MIMEQDVEAFLDYLTCVRKFSNYTVASYREDLGKYLEFLDTMPSANQDYMLSLDVARAWMAEMGKRGLKATTIKRRLCALRSFCKYLRREKKIDNNPLALLQSPKVPKPLPVWVTEAQMDDLLDNTDFGNDFVGKRDRLIIDLIYSTGMRRSEVASLKSADIDYANRSIRVLGKGKKMRIVPFGEELFSMMSDFSHEKMCLFGEDTHFFVVDESGAGLTPEQIAVIAHKYLSSIPTLARQTTHVLRHSFATNMLSNGADLMAVKELLGHASLQSTEVYTHLTPKDILANYRQAHPRSKK